MLNTITQFLINTPWWVYVLLVYLIKVGIKASKPNQVNLKKLFIIPTFFALLTVHTILYSFKLNAYVLGLALITLVIGALIGWLQVYRYALVIDKKQHLIQVPGTWSTLIVILFIFATKYYFSYKLAVNPSLVDNPIFVSSAIACSGLGTGLFIGKLICFLYRYKTAN